MIPYRVFNTLSKLKRKFPGGNPTFWTIRQKDTYEACRKELNDLLNFVVLTGHDTKGRAEK